MTEYQCMSCKRTVNAKSNEIPKCCGKSMKKIPIEICLQPSHSEHSRPMEDEDACNDFRSG